MHPSPVPTVAAPRLVPEPPLHLHSTFVISRGNITSRLSWQEPPSEAPITNYRVQWGEMLLDFGVSDDDANLTPILDSNTAYYKVLSQVRTRAPWVYYFYFQLILITL